MALPIPLLAPVIKAVLPDSDHLLSKLVFLFIKQIYRIWQIQNQDNPSMKDDSQKQKIISARIIKVKIALDSWNGKIERCSLARFTFYPYFTAMAEDYLFCYRKAKPGALFAACCF